MSNDVLQLKCLPGNVLHLKFWTVAEVGIFATDSWLIYHDVPRTIVDRHVVECLLMHHVESSMLVCPDHSLCYRLMPGQGIFDKCAEVNVGASGITSDWKYAIQTIMGCRTPCQQLQNIVTLQTANLQCLKFNIIFYTFILVSLSEVHMTTYNQSYAI